MRSGSIVPWILIAAMVCLPACSGESGRKDRMEPIKRVEEEAPSVDLNLDDVTLYATDIWEIDRKHGGEGVFRVMGELGERAGKEDSRALDRLVELLLASDGYMTEGLAVTLGDLFETNPGFFLDHTWQMEKKRRDLAYKTIIHENYYGDVLEKTYPTIWNDLKKMEVVSARFIRMYEYYIENPGHLEDWSVDPPD